MSWLPGATARAASLIKTEDGLEFKFGMVEKVQFFTINHQDLTDNVPFCPNGGQCNFRSFVSPDTNVGTNNSPFGIWNFTNLLFDLSKGPISIHVNLENEATVDENVADINHVNLERASLTWNTGPLGNLTVGFDVHLFDPEGGLIYQDEDPGLWLVGSQGNFSWNLGYHKRLARQRGKPLGNLIGGLTVADGRIRKTDTDANIYEARVGVNVPLPGGNLSFSPLFLANIRHVENEPGTGIWSCPSGNCGAVPGTGATAAEIYYPGLVVTGKLAPINFTLEAVGMFGEVRGLNAATQAIFGGRSKLDIEAWAVFGELSLDLTAGGIGLTPFVNVDFRSGDDRPTDKTLRGYVPISDLTLALRKDGFRLQSISSVGGVTFGNGGDDGWGFNTTGRGVGPTLGTILEGLGNDTSFFNSRWGKGDNPGLIKITAGLLGKITPQVDMKGAVSYFRFDTVEPIQVEGNLNRTSRGAAVSPAILKVDEDFGVEINFNIGWSPVPAFRIQPFASVFIPLQGADDIQRIFLDSDKTQAGYMAGVEFRAQF